MATRVNLKVWQEEFIKGFYDAPDRKTQILAGWYDWFCKDTSLLNKTKKMGTIIKQIKNGGKVDTENTYVFFKNNCPLNGPLYDDFRICDVFTGNVQFTIQLDCCWNEHKYTVFGRTPDGEFHSENPLFETDSKKELVNWLNTKWEVNYAISYSRQR